MKGKISELKQNEKNFFFKLKGEEKSYSGYGQASVREGDEVTFDVETKTVGDKTYNNAKNINKAGGVEAIDDTTIEQIAAVHTEMWVAVELAVAKTGMVLEPQDKRCIYIAACNSLREARE